MLEEYLRSAALVRVYAPPLAQRVAALNPRVAQIFAPVDLSLVPPPRETRPPGPVKIVYATSRTQDALCDIFQPALAQVASRYGDRIEIHFWGCRRPASVAGRNVHCHGLIYQYDRYLRCFSRGGYDIGLAPLPDDAFYRSKTNNKFREYGASGIAGIYSNNEVYSHCVEHEVSGLLVANTTEGWLRRLGAIDRRRTVADADSAAGPGIRPRALRPGEVRAAFPGATPGSVERADRPGAGVQSAAYNAGRLRGPRRVGWSGNWPDSRAWLVPPLFCADAAVAGDVAAAGTAAGLDCTELVRQRPLFCRLAELAVVGFRDSPFASAPIAHAIVLRTTPRSCRAIKTRPQSGRVKRNLLRTITALSWPSPPGHGSCSRWRC